MGLAVRVRPARPSLSEGAVGRPRRSRFVRRLRRRRKQPASASSGIFGITGRRRWIRPSLRRTELHRCACVGCRTSPWSVSLIGRSAVGNVGAASDCDASRPPCQLLSVFRRRRQRFPHTDAAFGASITLCWNVICCEWLVNRCLRFA